MLVILSGLPGSGKSAIADAIARAGRLPVLSVDPIESAMLRAGVPQSFETGLAAYLVAQTIADGLLGSGTGAVIDAVNASEEPRDAWRALALKHHAELRIIECVVSDPVLHRARLAARSRGMESGEPTLADVDARRSEWAPWDEPHLTLDAVDPLESNTMAALRYLGMA